MALFLQYRDGGKTDERGISTHLAGFFDGEVINGLSVGQDSPLGMSVLVTQGRCMIDSGDDYPYLGFTDDDESVAITTADGSNPRIDAIVAYVDLSVVDSTNANNPGAFIIEAVAGTPAGSPSAPNDAAVESAIGLGNPFIRLAHVTVGAGVTTITNGNCSDQRVMATIDIERIIDGAVTSDKLAEAFFKGRLQDGAGSNSAVSGLTVQMGWGYIVGDGTNRIEKTVTFDDAFSAAPLVFITLNSTRPVASGTPTGPGWFTTAIGSAVATVVYSNSITSSTFQAVIQRSDADVLANTNNYGFIYMAIGVV